MSNILRREQDQDEAENSCCESEEDYQNNSGEDGGAFAENQGNLDDTEVKASCSGNNTMGSTTEEYVEHPVEVGIMFSPFNEERMRRKLQFFFMNPIEKWKAKRRFPYKFVIQVIKIILVTLQLCLFAHSRYHHVNYTWDNRLAFSHLFLKGWDPEMEVESYPPTVGPLAIYKKSQMFEVIDYAVDGYANLSQSIGPYSYPSSDNTMVPLKLCIYSYREGTIFGFNESYIFNPEIDRKCFSLTKNITIMGSEELLQRNNEPVNFDSLVKATLQFSIKTVSFKLSGPLTAPDCYKFDIMILFDNSDHDGQMLLSLDANAIRLDCKGNVEYVTDTKLDAALRSILNIFVILTCFISFILCTRAIYRAQLLCIQTTEFFRNRFQKDLSWDGKLEFLNLWYVMIICNDVLLIIGSALKEQIERKYFDSDGWNTCSVFLGLGNLLVWFGVLRYLGFFKTYNVIILTLKNAAPKMLRFLLCALLIYAGFTFCGWLVLGPYHMKFRSLATTSECLFALINGDDLFATFLTMTGKSKLLWWFSRIYLYSFISLYMYVVLSSFVSIIMDAYDTIQGYYQEGFPQSDLNKFIGQINPEDYGSGVFGTDLYDDGEESLADVVRRLCRCCCIGPESQGPSGYESLPKNQM